MPYNFFADSIHTNKLYSRLSSSEVHFLTESGHFAFWTPFGEAYWQRMLFILGSLESA